jgi:hypothetical protein
MEITTISFIIVILLFYAVLASIRKGSLETKYSLLWIFTCIVLGILSISELLLNWIAQLTDVHYAPSILFLFGLLFILIIIFDLTRRISQLNHQLVTLTQDYAMLNARIDKFEKGSE